MNTGGLLFIALVAVQLCSLCLAGVLPGSSEVRELAKESSEEQDDFEKWEKTLTDDKLRHLSSEEEDEKMEIAEDKVEENDEVDETRPVRSATLADMLPETDSNSLEEIKKDDTLQKDDLGQIEELTHHENEEQDLSQDISVEDANISS